MDGILHADSGCNNEHTRAVINKDIARNVVLPMTLSSSGSGMPCRTLTAQCQQVRQSDKEEHRVSDVVYPAQLIDRIRRDRLAFTNSFNGKFNNVIAYFTPK